MGTSGGDDMVGTNTADQTRGLLYLLTLVIKARIKLTIVSQCSHYIKLI